MMYLHSQGPSIEVEFFVRGGDIVHTKLFPRDARGLTWRLVSDSACFCLERKIFSWMEEYCLGRQPAESLPVAFEGLPSFTRSVLTKLLSLSFGESFSYTELALAVGRPGACRAAGNACGRNPLPLIVPCHRILAHHRRLGGFSSDVTVKKRLLWHEGIVYTD